MEFSSYAKFAHFCNLHINKIRDAENPYSFLFMHGLTQALVQNEVSYLLIRKIPKTLFQRQIFNEEFKYRIFPSVYATRTIQKYFSPFSNTEILF